jgi:hypothetical protein
MSMSVDDFGLSQIVFFVINHSILARLLDHINLLLVVNQSGVTVLFPTGVDDFDVFPLIDHRFLEQLPFAVSNFHCVFEEEGAYLFRCFELHLSDFVGGVEESVVVGFVLPAFDISRVQILMPVIVTLHNTRNGCHALTEPN